ncbi:DNA mismatch repair protein MutS [Ammoniphilus oxalaticus]|uniref:DNA mismatch repair protein MutS n=1 Tax=Ammoniphilus oxalaticus TaxID=66863 RepID=A0A419SK79_9BACL|nr:DNA mismatch repair protein MutS [Ammoniphilus oxalaticus]RKD24308.1 DNA mismatch repair protein MutS [Ammoniphilus oxalaticus]
MAKYTPMIEQYLSIKADYPDAFLFFRLGDFYELFFEDAVLAARELEITLTGRGGGTEERIPMCGVPYHSVDAYYEALLKKGYKIAICEQVEDPKDAKGVVKREVVRVLTPGTVMEGKLLTDREHNYLVAAWGEQQQYALAACDITTGHFYGAWFDSIEQLVGEIASYQPKEVLVPELAQSEEISKQCSNLGVQMIERVSETERETYGQLAEQQFSVSIDKPLLRNTAGLLIAYLRETQRSTLEHIQEIEIYAAQQYMLIDPYSKRNLEITESLIEKKKQGSLLWYLDQTVTAMGARMLRMWVDKPLLNRNDIEKRLDSVGFFTTQLFVREQLRDFLKLIYDLERMSGRISFGNANAKDLIHLKQSLEVVPKIKQIFEAETNLPQGVSENVAELDSCPDIVALIGKSIVDDPPLSLKEGGLIKEGYHDHLDKLKTVSRDGKQWIANLEKEEREATGIRSLKVGYNRIFGYYIEVTKSNLAAIPSGRYERKQTLANAERFITPELKEQEGLILEAEEKLTELEYNLFIEIRSQVASHVRRLQSLAHRIAQLDVLASLAEVAQERQLVRPAFSARSELVIVEGRHPVVEKVLDRDTPFIPNDTVMDGEENRLLLVTGPNMAGKSTYMRQLALIVMMAQLGSFVPAKEARLSVVDQIFTRIGAADDLVGGQSTFMVEMSDIQLMTARATKDSLVIIDEIGRGTSTHDGMSIAQAVIEYVHDQIACRALVSTHYHELAVLEESLSGMKNYHMAVQEEKDRVIFLRKLKRGATDESYGIYCATLAGLPEQIIQRAEQLLNQYRLTNRSTSETTEKHSSQLEELVQESFQLGLFSETAPPEQKRQKIDKETQQLIQSLKEVDLINMTPLQAMNFLYEMKQKLT